jgi:hypothetical protein
MPSLFGTELAQCPETRHPGIRIGNGRNQIAARDPYRFARAVDNVADLKRGMELHSRKGKGKNMFKFTSEGRQIARIILVTVCVVALSTATTIRAGQGEAFAAKSTLESIVPPLEQTVLVDDGVGTTETLRTTLKIVAASGVVLTATKTDTMADTGKVAASKDVVILGPLGNELKVGPYTLPGVGTIPEKNAGSLSLAGVRSRTTISSSKVDSESSLADFRFSLKDPNSGLLILSITATGLKSVASAACASGMTGSVTVDKIEYSDLVQSFNHSGILPSIKQDLAHGYVIWNEQVPTAQGMTVNALHIFYDDKANGTFVDVIIGSAFASCQ